MKKDREEILILSTGGTIEAPRYPRGYENEPVFTETSIIPRLFEKHKFNYPYNLKVLFMKDSRYISESDRYCIFEEILLH